MSRIKSMGKKIVVQTLWGLLGRRNLARLGRMLSDEARLDVLNDPQSNGELMVQKQLLKYFEGAEALCIFDVGANIGEWSRSLVQQASPSQALKVYAFEPFPGTMKTLKQNLSSWQIEDRVDPQPFAMSSENGSHSFFSLGDNIGVNGFYPVKRENTGQSIEVQRRRLDDFCKEQEISRIHLLKIDTEGHDMEVLLGAKESLKSGVIEAVQFEYNWRWIHARHYLRDAFSLAQEVGMHLAKVTPGAIECYPDWHYELESFREGNYLLLKPSVVSAFDQITWWNQAVFAG